MKFLNANEVNNELQRLAKQYDEIYMMTAWATDGSEAYKFFVENQEKIQKAVIGLHFYQTSPNFIQSFMQNNHVKYIMQSSGIFHPKVYLFKNRSERNKKLEVEVIIGSSNFTQGGLDKNFEISVLLQSNELDAQIQLLMSLINIKFDEAELFNQERLEEYSDSWRTNRRTLIVLGTKKRRVESKASTKEVVDILSVDWETYLNLVESDEYHSIDGRLAILLRAEELFSQVDSFNDMTLENRQNIAGFSGRCVDAECNWNWGWFGSMTGSGFFKRDVNNREEYLSQALQCIPRNGRITEDNYRDYISIFRENGPYRENPIAVSSRLLCMKRPDYFVCINKGNIKQLSIAFQVNQRITVDNYWTNIISRIMESTWWQTADSGDGKYFCRAALLDAIYYEEI